MKKLLTVAAVLFLGTAVFAFDLGEIQGTWQDVNYDANWTFAADGTIVLSLASTGETVYTFTDANVQNFRLGVSTAGASVSFDCADTDRSYTFTKPISLGTDLEMHINPGWTDTDYDTTITFQH